jgi:V/A-type H+-transporting ATPase subunit C
MYHRISRKYPASMAPVLKYIYEKEQEIERVTMIIEGIRYQVPPKEIKDMVLITK